MIHFILVRGRTVCEVSREYLFCTIRQMQEQTKQKESQHIHTMYRHIFKNK